MTSYEDFVGEIQTLYDEIWTIAQEKLEDEENAMLASMGFVPGGGVLYYVLNEDEIGNPVAAEEAKNNAGVYTFVEDCCFDHSQIGNHMSNLEAATSKFDIGEAQNKISEDLAEAWDDEHNTTAQAFRDNYVRSIPDIHSDQVKLLERSRVALDGIVTIVERNREAIRATLDAVKEGLNKYDPTTLVTIGTAECALAIGGNVHPIAGALATVGSIAISEEKEEWLKGKDMTVLDVYQQLKKGIKELTTHADDDFKALKKALDERLELEKDYDNGYVNENGTSYEFVIRMPELP